LFGNINLHLLFVVPCTWTSYGPKLIVYFCLEEIDKRCSSSNLRSYMQLNHTPMQVWRVVGQLLKFQHQISSMQTLIAVLSKLAGRKARDWCLYARISCGRLSRLVAHIWYGTRWRFSFASRGSTWSAV